MFRRAVGSLLARRFSTPRMAPALSLHSWSWKDAAAGLVTRARIVNMFKIKKPTMEAKFERWMVENDKTYRDEEEKAMRFQLFKAALERTKLLRPIDDYSLLPEISYMADFTDEERGEMQGID